MAVQLLTAVPTEAETLPDLCFVSQMTAEPVSRVSVPDVHGRLLCQQLTQNLNVVRVTGVSM